jgi:hypothetical protein
MAYYDYPNSVSRGYYLTCPSTYLLTQNQLEDRDKWKSVLSDSFHPLYRDYITSFSSQKDVASVVFELRNRHGIYAEKFLWSRLRRNAEKYCCANPIEEMPNETVGRRLESSIEKASALVYDTWCLTILEDDCEIENNWVRENSAEVLCSVCSSTCRKIDIPDWQYKSVNGHFPICYDCRIGVNQNELLHNLREYVKTCGFIPSSNSHVWTLDFSSKFDFQTYRKLYILYNKFGGIENLKENYGSWFEALVEANCLPDNIWRTGRGIRCIANDGHECNSLAELEIDNWLSRNAIQHSKEPHYPMDPKLNPKGRMRADWLVADFYIEYFGLKGNSNYDSKTLKKYKLSDKHNLKLIGIFPEDLANLNDILGELKLFTQP